MKRFMTIRDLADELGISRRHAYRLVQAGAVPAARVGGVLKIPRAAWREWLREKSAAAIQTLRDPGQSVAATKSHD